MKYMLTRADLLRSLAAKRADDEVGYPDQSCCCWGAQVLREKYADLAPLPYPYGVSLSGSNRTFYVQHTEECAFPLRKYAIAADATPLLDHFDDLAVVDGDGTILPVAAADLRASLHDAGLVILPQKEEVCYV